MSICPFSEVMKRVGPCATESEQFGEKLLVFSDICALGILDESLDDRVDGAWEETTSPKVLFSERVCTRVLSCLGDIFGICYWGGLTAVNTRSVRFSDEAYIVLKA